MFPPCGRMAVMPVLIESPRAMVTCPTRTPRTSVIALSGPTGNTPTTIPSSRAVFFCAASGAAKVASTASDQTRLRIMVRPPSVSSALIRSTRRCFSLPPKLLCHPEPFHHRFLTTEVRVSGDGVTLDVAALAALESGKPMVYVSPPAAWALTPLFARLPESAAPDPRLVVLAPDTPEVLDTARAL